MPPEEKPVLDYGRPDSDPEPLWLQILLLLGVALAAISVARLIIHGKPLQPLRRLAGTQADTDTQIQKPLRVFVPSCLILHFYARRAGTPRKVPSAGRLSPRMTNDRSSSVVPAWTAES